MCTHLWTQWWEEDRYRKTTITPSLGTLHPPIWEERSIPPESWGTYKPSLTPLTLCYFPDPILWTKNLLKLFLFTPLWTLIDSGFLEPKLKDTRGKMMNLTTIFFKLWSPSYICYHLFFRICKYLFYAFSPGFIAAFSGTDKAECTLNDSPYSLHLCIQTMATKNCAFIKYFSVVKWC